MKLATEAAITILERSILVLMGCTTFTDGKEPLKSLITFSSKSLIVTIILKTIS